MTCISKLQIVNINRTQANVPPAWARARAITNAKLVCGFDVSLCPSLERGTVLIELRSNCQLCDTFKGLHNTGYTLVHCVHVCHALCRNGLLR